VLSSAEPSLPVGQVPSDTPYRCAKVSAVRYVMPAVHARFPLLVGVSAVALLVGDIAIDPEIAGGVSLSAVITLLLALVIAVLVPARILTRRLPAGAKSGVELAHAGSQLMLPRTLWLFLAWAAGDSLAQGHVGKQGWQNLSCYLIFVGGAAVIPAASSEGTFNRLRSVVIKLGWITVGLFAVGLVAARQGHSFYAPRSFAMEAIITMAFVVGEQSSTRSRQWLLVILAGEIVLSGSRTAMLVAALLLVVRSGRGRRSVSRAIRVSLGLLLLAVAGYVSLRYVPGLKSRFIGGDAAYKLFGTTLNTEGRLQIWRAIIKNADQSVWLGHGAGNASDLVRQLFPTAGEPHNDYLRVWNDFGVVGLGLWIAALGSLARQLWRSMGHPVAGERARTALISLAGLAVIGVTDNAFIYYFVVLPLAAVVGLGAVRPDCASPISLGELPASLWRRPRVYSVEPKTDDSNLLATPTASYSRS
jgi:O-antigen ligase